MDAPDAPQADDLAVAIEATDELLNVVGLSRSVIDLEKISYDTGIDPVRVQMLLDGKGVEPEEQQDSFQQRLTFLRATRLKPGGKRYTLDEIGDGAGVSHAQVSHLLNGKRSPGLALTARLEKFFGVQPGFFTATERQALCRALQPVQEHLTTLAYLKGKGVSQLAMRSGRATGDDSRLGQELRAALRVALDQPAPADPEVSALTDQMMSLPSKSRRRIFPLISGLLGLARPEDGGPSGPPGSTS